MLRFVVVMSLTPEDLQALRSEFPTRQELQQELARLATKDDLTRFATKDDLAPFATKEDLQQYSTRSELQQLRQETAQGFADMRQQVQVLLEDLKSTMKVLFDGLSARMDSYGLHSTSTADSHERRIDSLDIRVTALKHRRKPR